MFWVLGGIVLFYLLMPAMAGIGERLGETGGLASESFASRLQVQLRTTEYVLRHPRAFLIGMGDDSSSALRRGLVG